MTDLYLILHKVRGAPAFDIAQKLDIADEEGWIIPTSGHRAYPYATWELNSLCLMGWGIANAKPITQGISLQPPNASWPDHYQANASPREERLEANSLLASLGLPIKVHSAVSGTFKRRI